MLKYLISVAILLFGDVLPVYAGISAICNAPPTTGVSGPTFATNAGNCFNGTNEVDPHLGTSTTGPGMGTLYVNCNLGSGGAGTAASPYGSLAQAQTAMEAGGPQTTTVSGTCTLTANWNLTSVDSGQTWKADKNVGATIAGGVTTTTQPPNPGNTSLCAQGGTISGVEYAQTNGFYVFANGANNLSFYGFTFDHLASAPYGTVNGAAGGLWLQNGDRETVRWNTFTNSTMSAITLFNSNYDLIDSNTINGVSDGYPSNFNITTTSASDGLCYSPAAIFFDVATGAISMSHPVGVSYGGGNNNIISHNLIENTQGGAVNFSGSNNLIDSNVMQTVGTMYFDAGVIYTQDLSGVFPGNRITNNNIFGYASTIGGFNTFGIYDDEGTSNIIISGNAIAGAAAGSSIPVIMVNINGQNVKLVNNVIASNTQNESVEYFNTVAAPAGSLVQNNIFYSPSTFGSSIINNGAQATCPTDSTNLYWSATSASIPTSVNCPDGNVVSANPGFTSITAPFNFTASNTSALNTAGFTQLSTGRGPLPVGY